VAKKPPRNSHGLYSLPLKKYIRAKKTSNTTSATAANRSSRLPLSRSGPRMMAIGRHSIANPAPSISPPARVNELRYSVSLAEKQRPKMSQVPARNSKEHEPTTPGS
jgi:hypothetical protein